MAQLKFLNHRVIKYQSVFHLIATARTNTIYNWTDFRLYYTEEIEKASKWNLGGRNRFCHYKPSNRDDIRGFAIISGAWRKDIKISFETGISFKLIIRRHNEGHIYVLGWNWWKYKFQVLDSIAIQPIKNFEDLSPDNLARIARNQTLVEPINPEYHLPFIFGNDVDSIDVATRVAMVIFSFIVNLRFGICYI